MKRILSLLVLFVALQCQAFNHYTGVYYLTKSPVGNLGKESGNVDVWFYDDGTCEVDVFYDFDFLFTATGVYADTAKGAVFYARYEGNSDFFFSGKVVFDFITGNVTVFASSGTFKGKFQAVPSDHDSIADDSTKAANPFAKEKAIK